MSEPAVEALFVEHLPLIDRIAASLARRQGMSGDEPADLASWVKLKLVENDYAVLRKFRGESSLGTYLTVVIAMLVRDYRVQRWGRWRPSAVARRHGAVAVRLETLVRRDGFRLHQAGEMLRTAGTTTQSDRELATLLARLPARTPLRPVEVGAEPLAEVEASASADWRVEAETIEDDRRLVRGELEALTQQLSLEDRMILRLRFWEDQSIADIARALQLEQKPLYRRLERLLALLRQRLEVAGVSAERLQALLEEPCQ